MSAGRYRSGPHADGTRTRHRVAPPGLGAGPSEPDRRAHGLQRRPRASGSDPARDHAPGGRGCGRRTARLLALRARRPVRSRRRRAGVNRLGPIRPGCRGGALRARPAGSRSRRHRRVGSPTGGRALVLRRTRGRDRARALHGGRVRARAAPARARLPARRASRGRSAVRDPRPGGVPPGSAPARHFCSTAGRSSTASSLSRRRRRS